MSELPQGWRMGLLAGLGGVDKQGWNLDLQLLLNHRCERSTEFVVDVGFIAIDVNAANHDRASTGIAIDV